MMDDSTGAFWDNSANFMLKETELGDLISSMWPALEHLGGGL